jgi:hypothetical protein
MVIDEHVRHQPQHVACHLINVKITSHKLFFSLRSGMPLSQEVTQMVLLFPWMKRLSNQHRQFWQGRGEGN